MALGQDIERLLRVPVLRCLEPDALRLIAFAGESRIVAAGAVLFREGETSEGGYVVVTGSFVLRRHAGTEARVEAGALLGEAGLLQDVTHSATAVAVETATVFKLTRTVMTRVLEEHPLSARRMLVFLANRLNAALLER